ncbi:DUF1707 SHOCT-like domain-containing protein [Corynebacterium auris]|uniref:DUF1707 SHOCT-like domain-containing protein n=1 Tax=Corynebacterium auris TaxID=44750 RepID=UPI0025B2A8BC|nr:DUF1707 domain-containing protein [Corynebacterium auris]WJY68911.1 hypothetical protein CAURIS_10185 [Corynebacterium auris]
MTTPSGNFRISDAERSTAIDALGQALGEGRLSMEEFDTRCEAVAHAQFKEELDPLFRDLPARSASPTPMQPGVYTADEIRSARRQGQRTRAGVFWLGTFASLGGTMTLAAASASAASAVPLLIIPTLFVLFYVMKVGPDSWYTPSLRQLERQRRELVRSRQIELEAAQADEIAAQRAQRRQQVNKLTSDALDVAQQTVNRFKKQ